jgi:hypothetical protein
MPGNPTAEQLAAMAESRLQSAKSLHQLHQEAIVKEIFKVARIKQIDKWIADQNDPAIDRLEAIRRLVEIGLKAKGK